jgi:hypothetical protein
MGKPTVHSIAALATKQKIIATPDAQLAVTPATMDHVTRIAPQTECHPRPCR